MCYKWATKTRKRNSEHCRQEILSGISGADKFEEVREHLEAFLMCRLPAKIMKMQHVRLLSVESKGCRDLISIF